jgi:subtilisin family serine protease
MAQLCSTAFGVAAFLIATSGSAVLAQTKLQSHDVGVDEAVSAAERAETTSFVWLPDREGDAGIQLSMLRSALEKEEFFRHVLFYGDDGNNEDDRGLLMPMGVEDTRRLLSGIFGERAIEELAIEPNVVVYGFGSACGDALDSMKNEIPYTPQYEDLWGVLRLWHGHLPPDPYSGAHTAWIIDSGIDPSADTELNVASRWICSPDKCVKAQNAKQKRDLIGHGTFIAGIIGAIDNGDEAGGGEGVVGIAPNAPLNAVRIFGRKAETNLDRVYRALLWLKGATKADSDSATPSPGDVVNVSLGTDWNPAAGSSQAKIEDLLRDLADAGLNISVAAGNTDVLRGKSGYVQTVSPARAGGYRSPEQDGGVIMTASAIEKDANPNNLFWKFSAFGNFSLYPSGNRSVATRLPDYAEPGKSIVSIWPGDELAECSGTSFAAAHLAGLLLWDMPNTVGYADKDPSAEIPGKLPTEYDPALSDPIGVR